MSESNSTSPAASQPAAVGVYVPGSITAGGDVNIHDIHIEQAQERLADAIIAPDAVFERVHVERFAGRAWLLAQVDAFLRQEQCGYFVLEAEAGLGKTSFMAWLARARGYACLFCEDAPGLENVGRGLKSLAAQLVQAYRLAPWADAGTLPPAAERPDIFRTLLKRAVEAVRGREPVGRVVLVIDALDQAGAPEKQNALALPRTLPEGVFIIASQRPASVELDVDAPLNVVELAAEQEDNLGDMRQFLARAAAWPGISQALQAGGTARQYLIDVLMDKCCGVWIYLHYVLHDLESGRRTLAQLHDLPDGIVNYYLEYWREERRRDGAQWYSLSLPLLAALAAAPEPATARQLCAWAGVTGQLGQAQRKLNEDCCSFISATGGDRQPRYRFYHATVREFFAGQIDRRGLPKAARGFIDELRCATLAALYRILRAAATTTEKRRTALQLVRWRGVNDIEDAPVDEFLEILELVGGVVYAEAERRYLIESIDSVLAAPSGGLSRRQQARLLVYRAVLYGNLGEMGDADSSYRQAEALSGGLSEAADAQPEDLKLNARIKHGRGIIVRARAESSEDPSEEEHRRTLLEEGRALLLDAVSSAQSYGKDRLLWANALKELCWTYALLAEWPSAEAAYQTALEVLEEAEDSEGRDSYRARLLQTASCMHWARGETLGDNPGEAVNEYRKALALAEEEITIRRRLVPSVSLVLAYTNWGEYAMAADQLTGEHPPQYLDRACERWRTAAELALALGLPQSEVEYANRLIEQHCPGSASSGHPTVQP